MMKCLGLPMVLVMLAACSAQTREPEAAAVSAAPAVVVEAVEWDAGRVRAIADVFATEHGMMNLCGEVPVSLTLFMAELAASNASRDLVDSVTQANDARIAEISLEEPEYICTPEMTASREANVSAARDEWNVMRGAQ